VRHEVNHIDDMTNIDYRSLNQILLEPPSPVEQGNSDIWAKMTSLLGKPLPNDFMWYIDTYGSGSISDFVYVFNPFSGNKNFNFQIQVIEKLSILGSIKQSEGEKVVPYSLCFEPGGLLPWGGDDNGDTFYWLTTAGSSDNWTVVLGQARGDDWEEYPFSMTVFLKKLLTKEIHSNLLPDDFVAGPDTPLVFKPIGY